MTDCVKFMQSRCVCNKLNKCMDKATYTDKIQTLPITPYLDTICDSLQKSNSHFLVLTAETAAGKSTAVPLALLKHFPGKSIMLEPRRLAVLNIASRVADLLGEEVGKTCGYQIHLESKFSASTRFLVLTEAILTRKIQEDPSLEGISVVVIDEFHERSIHTDLALAFLKEAITMRDDLYVIVMSATINTEKVSTYLSAPIVHIPGRQFPVKIVYENNKTPCEAVLAELKLGSDKEVSGGGSILVFLPGISEIRRTQAELQEAHANAEIVILHSSISFSEQKKIFQQPAASSTRRVILSSAIAETSLTVPGVTVVIDSGLSRINSFNRSVGMETLVTRNESVFNAEQRAGRAGRVAAGKCIRLWNESDVRTTETPPEIMRTDLTELVLECAEWGISSLEKVSWLDEPPVSSWETATDLLEQLGCLAKGQITSLGKAVLTLGVDVRLACVALSGIPFGKETISIEVASKFSQYADTNQQKNFILDLKNRVEKVKRSFDSKIEPIIAKEDSIPFCSSLALLAGFPDRIARKMDTVIQNSALYQFPSGRVANLVTESHLYPHYLVAPNADAGERTGRIYSWEQIEDNLAEKWLFDHATIYSETIFIEGTQKLQKTEYTAYGKLLLKSCKISSGKEDYKQAVCSAVKEKGIEWLPLSAASKNLLLRVQFYCENKVTGENDTNESLSIKHKYEHLSLTADTWLAPFMVSDSGKITEEMVYSALQWYLEGSVVTASVPTEFTFPNGRRKQLRYEQSNEKIVPVLEVIIQQIFGCLETPKIMGVPVVLKLLSPARRPLQITNDLEHFWKDTWPEICKEMKGRYPKHNWDYHIISDEE